MLSGELAAVTSGELDVVAERLSRAGFVAGREEAADLVAWAAGDRALLESLVVRRLTGEPLAWITGSVVFCGMSVRVDSGVYVPRSQTEDLARRAVARLPVDGVAIDLCTGAGAVAAILQAQRPAARVVGTDLSEAAVACARANGVDVFVGDLFQPVPVELAGRVDLVVGVVPYVPTEALRFLQRDALVFEPVMAFDGGPGGVDLLRRAIAGATAFLRPGAALILEMGGDQHRELSGDLARHGYVEVTTVDDQEGDIRGIEATFAACE